MEPITDPDALSQLNASYAPAPATAPDPEPITDPDVLAQLNTPYSRPDLVTLAAPSVPVAPVAATQVFTGPAFGDPVGFTPMTGDGVAQSQASQPAPDYLKPPDPVAEWGFRTLVRKFDNEIFPATATALGGLAAGAAVAPSSILAGPAAPLVIAAADVTGGAAAGVLARNLQDTAFDLIGGEGAADRQRAQMAVNAKAHPYWDQAGSLVPMLIGFLFGGSKSSITKDGTKVGEALTPSGSKAVLSQDALNREAAIYGLPAKSAPMPFFERVASSAAIGARGKLSEDLQKKMVTGEKNADGSEINVPADVLKEAFATGTLGALPEFKGFVSEKFIPKLANSLGVSSIRGVADTALYSAAEMVADSVIKQQPPDFTQLSDSFKAGVGPFVITNLLMSGVHGGHSLLMANDPINHPSFQMPDPESFEATTRGVVVNKDSLKDFVDMSDKDYTTWQSKNFAQSPQSGIYDPRQLQKNDMGIQVARARGDKEFEQILSDQVARSDWRSNLTLDDYHAWVGPDSKAGNGMTQERIDVINNALKSFAFQRGEIMGRLSIPTHEQSAASSFAESAASSARDAGLNVTADTLATPLSSRPPAEPVQGGPGVLKMGRYQVPLADTSAKGLLTAAFGTPPPGRVFHPDLKTGGFALAPTLGKSPMLQLHYQPTTGMGWTPTSAVYDPKTQSFSSLHDPGNEALKEHAITTSQASKGSSKAFLDANYFDAPDKSVPEPVEPLPSTQLPENPPPVAADRKRFDPTGDARFDAAFPPDHVHYHEGEHLHFTPEGKELPSVTTTLGEQPGLSFDAQAVSLRMANGSPSKALSIRERLDATANAGSAIRESLSDVLTTGRKSAFPGVNELAAHLQAMASGPVISERPIRNDTHAGTIHGLVPNKDGDGYTLVELETMADGVDPHNPLGSYQTSHQDSDSKFIKHEAQLATYVHMLAEKGIKVTRSFIVPMDRYGDLIKDKDGNFMIPADGSNESDRHVERAFGLTRAEPARTPAVLKPDLADLPEEKSPPTKQQTNKPDAKETSSEEAVVEASPQGQGRKDVLTSTKAPSDLETQISVAEARLNSLSSKPNSAAYQRAAEAHANLLAQRPRSLESPTRPSESSKPTELRLPMDDLSSRLVDRKSNLQTVPTLDTHPAAGEAPLPVGALVIGTSPSGEPKSVHVVTLTDVLASGSVRHYLTSISVADGRTGELVRQIATYEPHPSQTTLARNLLDRARTTSNLSSLGQAHADTFHSYVLSFFNTISSNEWSRDHVEFVDHGTAMRLEINYGKPNRVLVNSTALWNMLADVAAVIPGESNASDGLAQDFSKVVHAMAYHEVTHDVAANAFTPEEVVAAAHEMALHQSEGFADQALTALRKPGSFGDGQLGDLRHDQVHSLFLGETVSHGGQDYTMSEDQRAQALFQIGHEFLARTQEIVTSGSSVADRLKEMSDFANSFGRDSDGKPIEPTKAQSLIQRLITMSRRLVDAIQRFMATHRLLGKLPEKMAEMSLRLDALMRSGGILAPDFAGIHEAFARHSADTLDRARRFRNNDFDNDSLKRQLREGINVVRVAEREPNLRPVTMAEGGRLVLTGDLSNASQALLQPMLDELNSPARVELAATTSDMYRGLDLYLRRLNGGRSVSTSAMREFLGGERTIGGLKSSDIMDPARQADTTTAKGAESFSEPVIANLAVSMERTLGMPLAELIQGLNHSIGLAQNNYSDPLSGGPSVYDLFRKGGVGESYFKAHGGDVLARYDNSVATAAKIRATLVSIASDTQTLAQAEKRSKLKEAYDAALSEQAEHASTLATMIREMPKASPALKAEVARMAEVVRERVDASLDRHAAYQRALRPVRGLRDLVTRYTARPERMLAVLEVAHPGMARKNLEAALNSAADTFWAIDRVKHFASDLQSLLVGGRVKNPDAIRRDERFRNINADLSRIPSLPDFSLINSILPPGTVPTSVLEAMAGSEAARSAPPAGGSISVPSGPTSKPFTVGTSAAAMSAGPDAFANAAAKAVRDGSSAVSKMLGVEPSKPSYDEKFKLFSGPRLASRLIDSALAINQALVSNVSGGRFRGDPAMTSEAVRSAGFPIGLAWSEEGVRTTSIPRKLVDIPELSLQRGDEGETLWPDSRGLVESGAFGSLVAAAGRVQRLLHPTSSDNTTAPVLSTIGGLTPAGFVSHIISSKLIELLALTKGVSQDAIIHAITNPAENELVRGLYNSLVPGIESSPVFKAQRASLEKSQDPGKRDFQAIKAPFWELRRLLKVANAIYSDSISRLGSRDANSDADEADLDKPINEMLPVSRANLANFDFMATYHRAIRTDAAIPGPDGGGVLASPFTAVSAGSLLAEYDSIAPEEAPLRVAGTQKTNKDGSLREFEPGDYARRSTDNPQEDTGRVDLTEITESQHADALRAEQDHADILRGWTGKALMALYGGDQNEVLRHVNHSRYCTISTDGRNVPLYDHERIQEDILNELRERRKEEIARGVLLDDKGRSYDSIINSLALSNTHLSPLFDGLAESGGSVRLGLPESEIMSRLAGNAYHADAGGLVQEIALRMPVSIINGNARHEGASDLDANGFPRVPSISIIGDASGAYVIFPRSGTFDLAPHEARRAMSQALLWHGTHGGVDLSSLAHQALSPLLGIGDGSLLETSLRESILATASHDEKGLSRVVTDDQRAAAANEAKRHVATITNGIAKELGELHGEGSRLDRATSDYFNPARIQELLSSPDGIPHAIPPAIAADILSVALIDPAAQRILSLATVNDPQVSPPSDFQTSRFGAICGPASVPLEAGDVAAEFNSNLPDGIAVEDERGVAVSAPGGGFNSLSLPMEAALAARLDSSSLQAPAVNPRVFQQWQWAAANLHDVFSQVRFTGTAPTAVPGEPRNSRLTSFDRVQMLANFAPEARQVDARIQDDPFIRMSAVSAMAADRLSGYDSISPSDGEAVNKAAAMRAGTLPYDSINRHGDVNHSAFRLSREAKGAIAIAGQLGEVTPSNPHSRVNVITVDANIRSLIAGLNHHGLNRFVPAGPGLPPVRIADKVVADYALEKKESLTELDRLRNEGLMRSEKLEAARSALSTFQSIKDQLLSADSQESMRQVLEGFPVIDASGVHADSTISQLFDGRDQLAEGMARSLVKDYSGLSSMLGSISLRSASSWSKGAAARRLADISLTHSDTADNIEKNLGALRRKLAAEDSRLSSQAFGDDEGDTYDANGHPSWYSSVDASRARDLRDTITNRMTTYNRFVDHISGLVNDAVDGGMSANRFKVGQFRTGASSMDLDSSPIGRPGDRAQASMRDFASTLRSLTHNSAVADMVRDAGLRTALRSINSFTSGDGVSSIDLSGLSGDRRVGIPEAAVPQLRQALADHSGEDAVAKIASILAQHLSPFEEVREDAVKTLETTLKTHYNNALENLSPDQNAAINQVMRLANSLASANGLDPVTANKVLANILGKRLADNGLANEDKMLKLMIDTVQRTEEANRATNGIAASRPDGYTMVNLVGTPEEVEVGKRLLRAAGSQWDGHYREILLQQRHAINYSDTLHAQRYADRATLGGDQALEMLADEFSVSAGLDYYVADGLLVPSDSYTRAARLLPGSVPPTRANVLAHQARLKYDLATLDPSDAEAPARVANAWILSVENRVSALEAMIAKKQQITATPSLALPKLLEGLRFNLETARAELRHLKSPDFLASMQVNGPAPGASPFARLFLDSPEYDKAYLDARTNPVIHNLRSVLGAKRDPEVAGEFGDYDPRSASLSHLRSMLDLAHRELPRMLPGYGVRTLPDGQKTPDLKSRLTSALANLSLSSAGHHELGEFMSAATDLATEIEAERAMGSIRSGYVNTDHFKGFRARASLKYAYHDGFLSSMFARSSQALRSANHLFANYILAPRSAALVQINTLGDVIHKAETALMAVKSSGDGILSRGAGAASKVAAAAGDLVDARDKFGRSARGFTAAVIESALFSGSRGPETNAAALLEAIDISSDGYNALLDRLDTSNHLDGPVAAAARSVVSPAVSMKRWATDPAHRVLQERIVHNETLASFRPVLEAIRDGADPRLAVIKMWANRDLLSRNEHKYGKRMLAIANHVHAGWVDSMALQGHDPAPLAAMPSLSFLAKSFGPLGEELPTSGIAGYQMDGALGGRNTGFSPAPGTVRVLSINAGESVMRQLSDKIRRQNIVPGLNVFRGVTGDAPLPEGEKVPESTPATSRTTELARDQGLPESDQQIVRAGSAALARLGDSIIRKDHAIGMPQTVLAQSINDVSLLFSFGALMSFQQIVKQHATPMLAYVPRGQESGVPNAGHFHIWGNYLGSLAMDGFASSVNMVSRAVGGGDLIDNSNSYAKVIQDFSKRYLPNVYFRKAGGEIIQREAASAARPSIRQSPGGPLAHGVKRLTVIPSTAVKLTYDLAGQMLQKVFMGSPERAAALSIGVHALADSVNTRRLAEGLPAVGYEDLVRNPGLYGITEADTRHGEAMAIEMLPPSDRGLMGDAFTPSGSIGQAIHKGFYTMFASHRVNLSTNAAAGFQQAWRGEDAKTKWEGARKFTAASASKLIFTLIQARILYGVGMYAYAKVMGWSDEKRHSVIAAWDGMHVGPMTSRLEFVGQWANHFFGGDRQWGFNGDGNWEESRSESDAQAVHLKLLTEIGTLIAGRAGILANAPYISALTEVALKYLALPFFSKAEPPEYIKAGIALPREPGFLRQHGFDGQGRSSDSPMARTIYGATSLLINHGSDKSALLGGMAKISEAVAAITNTNTPHTSWENLADIASIAEANLPTTLREESTRIKKAVAKRRHTFVWDSAYKK